MFFFLLAFILIAFVAFLQGLISVFYAGAITLCICYVFASCTPHSIKKNAINLTGLLYCIYWISSAIISLSFENGQMFYVKDPSEYYSLYQSIHSFKLQEYIDNLSNLYLTFKDNNALYNSIMAWLAYLGNGCVNGANMMYYTSFHLLFGVLAALAEYRIMCMLEKPINAFRHTLIFGCLSLYHIYSCVCVRDIWIAATFLWGIVIVLRKTSLRGLLCLFFLFVFTAGTRIYSGLFFIVFIVYYLYKMAQTSPVKGVYYIVMFIFGVVALTSAVGALLLEQTVGDMDALYEEIEGYGVSGLSAYIIHLPHGFREPVLVFYSQIMPFPSIVYFNEAHTFSHYYTSTIVALFPLFSFFVFYGLLYVLFFKKKYRMISKEDWILFGIAILLIMANSSQMDVRRVMPSFFIFFYLYIKIFNQNPQLSKRRINNLLGCGYAGLLLIYTLIKVG